MQQSLHDDRAAFSATSDDRPRASTSMSCASWAAAATTTTTTTATTRSSSIDNCMHAGSAAAQGPGSYFRQLFSEEAGAEAAGSYVEELLQLQLPPAASAVETSFDVLSSSDVYDTYASSHCSVGDFDTPPSFSMEGFLTSGGTVPGSPKQNGPHTLEFVSPPATSVSPPAPSSCFHGMSSKKSRLPDAAASLALPPEVQSSEVDGNLRYAKASDARNAKANSVNAGEEEEAQCTVSEIVASSFKKARVIPTAEHYCSGAPGNESSQFQAIMSKSARSKEKLGERINALQQLVSPFGKTDTASVLSEAIGYIKFLQEQVQVLSSPYMKPTSTLTRQDMGAESTSDLRSRGLCLVPVSCTINVANNNNFNIGADYWASTPSVGGSTPSTRFSASS